jgi:hypothetical protein
MLKFSYYPNRDKGEVYLNALLESGIYEQTLRATNADFILSDYEGRCPSDVRTMIKKGKCVFIYPHAALTFISYDGMYPSDPGITGNFVPSHGQRKIMWQYGYKCPVYPVGWSYSPVLPFKPKVDGNIKILFAPNHSIPTSRKRFASLYWDKRFNQNLETFTKLIRIPNSTLTIYYSGDIVKDNNIPNLKEKATYIKSDLSIKKSVEMIGSGEYDIVVGFDTFAWIAVAMGVPTIFFGRDLQWEGILGKAKHWDDYKDFIRYPYDILDPEFTTKDFEQVLTTEKRILQWKEAFIGQVFDKETFLNHVRLALELAERKRVEL